MNVLPCGLLGGLLLIGHSIFAQSQERSIGVRFAYGSGISLRQKLTEKHTLEGLLTSRWGGAAITGLYERTNMLGSSEQLHWYYGGGMHLAVHRRSNKRPPEFERMSRSHVNVGFDLIIGASYRFRELPIAVSLDFKPTVSFTTQEWVPETFGLSLRYVW